MPCVIELAFSKSLQFLRTLRHFEQNQREMERSRRAHWSCLVTTEEKTEVQPSKVQPSKVQPSKVQPWVQPSKVQPSKVQPWVQPNLGLDNFILSIFLCSSVGELFTSQSISILQLSSRPVLRPKTDYPHPAHIRSIQLQLSISRFHCGQNASQPNKGNNSQCNRCDDVFRCRGLY